MWRAQQTAVLGGRVLRPAASGRPGGQAKVPGPALHFPLPQVPHHPQVDFVEAVRGPADPLDGGGGRRQARPDQRHPQRHHVGRQLGGSAQAGQELAVRPVGRTRPCRRQKASVKIGQHL